jgi:hypothetical protein
LQAVAKAAARQSFVVTTGTGSGKSLCFSVPIIDSAIRARIAGETQPDTSSSDGGSRLLEAPACGYENASAPISTYAADYRTVVDGSSI